MRDIKFRAWAYEPKSMMEWHFIEHHLTDAAHMHRIGQWHLMQYAGLKDKNGKEIYEGDIIKYGHRLHQVKWEERDDHDCSHAGFDTSWLGGEVIGNIYEHGNLLVDTGSRDKI